MTTSWLAATTQIRMREPTRRFYVSCLLCYNHCTHWDYCKLGKDWVTTCVENLEMLGILSAVSEMSGILPDVSEMSGKKSYQGKVSLNCLLLAAYLCPFSTLCWVWFHIMHCCIPTSTTDNNTSTGMIWVTLNMGIGQECREHRFSCLCFWVFIPLVVSFVDHQ